MASDGNMLLSMALEIREGLLFAQKHLIDKTCGPLAKDVRIQAKCYRRAGAMTTLRAYTSRQILRQTVSVCAHRYGFSFNLYSDAIMPASTALATAWKRLWASNLRMMPDSSVSAAVRSMSIRAAMRAAG